MSSVLDSIFNNLRGLCIGKFYSKTDLAFVNRGQSLPDTGLGIIAETIMKVSFPALAQLQDDREKFRDVVRRMIQCSTFFVFPSMAGLAILSDRLVPLLFGNQWLGSIPYAQLACLTFSLCPLHVINLQAMTAMGRSDMFLGLEIIKKILGLLILLASIRHGVFFLMLMYAFVSSPMSLVINAWPNRRLLRYTIIQQIRDVMPTVLISFAMCGAIFIIRILFEKSGLYTAVGDLLLIPIVLTGMTVFVVLAIVFKIQPAVEYVRLLRTMPRCRCCAVEWIARLLGVD